MPTLYGIGLGPGNPKLLTLHAVEVLKEAPRVFVPSSKGRSMAENTVRYFVERKRIVRLDFPMVKDEEVLVQALRRNACEVCRVLRKLGSCAYAALGDLSLYSTFWRLYPYVKEMMPDLNVSIIPGVPSFCACAASAKIPLALGEDAIVIAPLTASRERIEALARLADTLVFLKAKPNVVESLELAELGYVQATLAAHCSMANEQLRVVDVKELKKIGEYFALAIVKRRRLHDGAVLSSRYEA